ncbi:hypothetical protein ACFXKD_03920 [Nocardiopsis aegyptia]|uniref:hypothetical protein n=1 Tax=Nocardiopsis aegyptia TaxID=220378 RepID=UPI003672C237
MSLLFAAHLFCSVGAVDSASASQAEGTVAAAGPASAEDGSPHAGGTTAPDHPCPSDAGASADQRASAVTVAVLPGLATATALLRAPAAHALSWRPSGTAAVPWSGTRLLVSLCVRRV